MTVSSSSTVQGHDIPARAPGAWWRKRDGYLFNPLLDFLCLGGGSMLVLGPLYFLPAETFKPAVAVTFLVLANLINHPHFAYSYQIFYRNFREKAFGETYSPVLRARYIVAGIVAPLALTAFFLIAVIGKDARLLAYGGNLMVFLTGWHYVKQGYGMVIVDSVLKKNFFSQRDKNILLVNSYVCWAFHWFLFNRIISEHDLWGLKYYSFATPTPLLVAVGAVAGASGLAAFWVLLRKWRSGGAFPLNGALAYLVTLYIWLLIGRFAPLMLLAVPAFHSLQYLIVVWRYQLNIENDRATQTAMAVPQQAKATVAVATGKPVVRVVLFVVSGILLGFAGFWLLPFAFDLSVGYDKALFGSSMFLFMFWVFINVHHYFLDNVMWRRENPDMGKYLFAAR